MTHNTCSGIQIAEGFKEVMKRMHSDEKQKILVLVSRSVMPNFKKQIYDIGKESKKIRPDDVVQCTGNEYSLDFEQYSSLTRKQKIKETTKKVNNVYKFYGYEQFANELMTDLHWDGKITSLTDIQKKALKQKFNNRVIIIDEIHNIKADSKNVELRKVPPILQAIVRFSENIRLVLMSATPMYDNAEEFIYILNLLLENDGRQPIEKKDIFDAENNLVPGAEGLIKNLTKGYVSFLRGDNPNSFPLKIYPQIARTPNIIYDIKGNKISDSNKLRHMKLFLCEMSSYQNRLYDKVFREIKNENFNSNESSYNTLRPITNIVLPNKQAEHVIARMDYAYQKQDNGDGPFIVDMGGVSILGKETKFRKKTMQFKYQSHVKFDLGKETEAPFLDEKHLQKYSTKFYEALMNIKGGKGICYVYSEFVWGGVLPFAMMLEQNGFERYPFPGERQFLDYNKKRNPICAICGKNFHRNSDHEFKRARYILMTGNQNLTLMETGSLLNIMNSDNNKYGEECKIIIGTRKTGEGLDFKRIRQIHVLEPWYNMSRLDQIIGRGGRYCSHADLPEKERNVEIFFYAVMPDKKASKKTKETETIDTRYYRIAEVKDKKIKAVEYIIKQSAVDCVLNKNGNVFDFGKRIVYMLDSKGNKIKVNLGDVDYSRECDYQKCNYQCVWEPEKGKNYKINTDTYTERFARTDIEKSKRIIKEMYNRGYIYELGDLVKRVNHKLPQLENWFIYIGIQEMLNNINEPVYDMYGRRGYLIYKGKYYVYQPMEFNYLKAPLRYRMMTLDVKTPFYTFENELEEENINLNKKDESGGNILEEIMKEQEKLNKILTFTDKDKQTIILGMIVDKLTDLKKISLLRKIVYDYVSTNGKMSSPILSILFFYFNDLLLFKGRDMEFKEKVNNDKLIGFYYFLLEGRKTRLKTFCLNDETKVITECLKDVKEKIKARLLTKFSKERKSNNLMLNNIYGFMERKDGPYVFKIYNKTKEQVKRTKENERSKRSEVRGKECSSHSLEEIKSLGKILDIKQNKIQKKTGCYELEYVLRKNDIIKLNNRLWFLNSIDFIKSQITIKN